MKRQCGRGFNNGLLLMTLPFSLLGVLAYWAVGEDY